MRDLDLGPEVRTFGALLAQRASPDPVLAALLGELADRFGKIVCALLARRGGCLQREGPPLDANQTTNSKHC